MNIRYTAFAFAIGTLTTICPTQSYAAGSNLRGAAAGGARRPIIREVSRVTKTLGVMDAQAQSPRAVRVNQRGTSCQADVDLNGTLNQSDVFSFLDFYFANDLRADMSDNGVIGVQDLFDFVSLYMRGCTAPARTDKLSTPAVQSIQAN